MEVIDYSESLASSWWKTLRRIREEINVHVSELKFIGECENEYMTRPDLAYVYGVRHLDLIWRMRESYGLISYLVMYVYTLNYQRRGLKSQEVALN